ncbi:uncharacterized protein [Maniola hyperantus]|uniref:uncharacterized protein n=1 Tax=Aphantopus hyperantus TaxID=2795564 RepID=UPI00374952DF
MDTKLRLILFIMIFLPVSKSDYVLYEITAFNPRERVILYNMQSKITSVIFLNGVSNEAAIPMNVVVNKKIYHMFEGSMRSLKIQCNLVSQIKSEQLFSYQKHRTVSSANISDTFYDWDEILKWIARKINRKFKKDRFWSKNRRKLDTETNCENENEPIGVSIARNWFYQKTLKRVGEACNSVYIGHIPISEEENQGLSYVLNNLALSMISFINVRGFGQYITVPYADVSAKINNHDIVMEILKATSYKVRTKHNTTIDIGTTSNYFYNFTGNMADWVKNKLNTPLVYTVYLDDIFSIPPHPKNIKTISKQFYTILNESLLVTKDIYGPLFNDGIKATINFLLLNTIFILQILWLTIV